MSGSPSLISSKARPTNIAARSSTAPEHTGTLEQMDPQDSNQELNQFSSTLNEPTTTRSPNLPSTQIFFERDARTNPALPPHRRSSNNILVDNSSGGGVFVASDGSLVRSSTGFKAGTVLGNYRSPFDHNMVHRTIENGNSAISQQYIEPLPSVSLAYPVPSRLTRSAMVSTAQLMPQHAPECALDGTLVRESALRSNLKAHISPTEVSGLIWPLVEY